MIKVSDTKDIGALIRTRRRKLGYTQTELAEIVGIGITYISQLENGKETAEIGKALYIVQMLGIDLFAKERS